MYLKEIIIITGIICIIFYLILDEKQIKDIKSKFINKFNSKEYNSNSFNDKYNKDMPRDIPKYETFSGSESQYPLTKDDIQQSNPVTEIVSPKLMFKNDTDFIGKDVFFDIKIGNNPPERVTIKLYDDVVPKTAMNFRKLCCLDLVNNEPPYKNSKFHRVIKNFMIQGGDFTKGDGTGGVSTYGKKFDDENFKYTHDKPGLLSMANSGPNTNGSQFFITTAPARHLDGKHVVFGNIIDGMNIIQKIEHQQTDNNNKPLKDCVIINCGLV